MRVTRIVGGLVLSVCIAAGGIAQANGSAKQQTQSASGFRASSATGARKYSVNAKGWVVRNALPANSGKTAAQRIAVLKESMEDEIEGGGHFKGENDTPAFEIVSHGPTLHQVAEAGYAGENEHQNGGVARYQVKAAELTGGKLDVSVLLPVSGHVGISSAQNYANTNVFRLQHNGGAWESVPAKGAYVTEVKRSLTLKPGVNTIMMEPYAGGFGGYSQGRTVEIEVVK